MPPDRAQADRAQVDSADRVEWLLRRRQAAMRSRRAALVADVLARAPRKHAVV